MLAIAASTPFAQALANDTPAGPRARGAMLIEHLLDTVDATDAQRTQIEAIEAKYHPQLKDLHQQIHQNHRSEMDLDTTSSNYLAQASSLIDQRVALMAQAEKLHAQMRQEMSAVLTDDQRKKLHAEMASFHQRHHFLPSHGE
jgi:Spy/CpxP family protein refolding chaperone